MLDADEMQQNSDDGLADRVIQHGVLLRRRRDALRVEEFSGNPSNEWLSNEWPHAKGSERADGARWRQQDFVDIVDIVYFFDTQSCQEAMLRVTT